MLGIFILIGVIKLKSILTEGRENSNCWMAPSGKSIPVKDTHMTTAMEILPKWREDRIDPMMELWKKGYLRVTYMYDGSLLVNNEVHPPNERQMAALKNLAIEGEHTKITWDKGDDEKILWTYQDTLQEVMKDNVEYVGPDDIDYDYSGDLNTMERESGIRILRDKEVSTLALQNGKVVGALYTAEHPYEFSFDLIVAKEARGQGIGAKLIDSALAQYRQEEIEMGKELRLDVVNPWVEKYLLHKGLVVLEKLPGRAIMGYPKEQGIA